MQEAVAQIVSVLNSVPCCVAVLDKCGRVLGVNEFWQQRSETSPWFRETSRIGESLIDVLDNPAICDNKQFRYLKEDICYLASNRGKSRPRSILIPHEVHPVAGSVQVSSGKFPAPCSLVVTIVFADESHLQHVETINAANVGLWDWDLQTNTVWYSPEWKRQLGFEDYELGNQLEVWTEHLHPDDHDRSVEKMHRFIDRLDDEYRIEFRLRHKDGSYRWILSHGTLLESTDGKPIRVRGYHVDITEIRETLDALRDSEERYQQIFERTEAIKIIFDPQTGQIVESNPAAQRFYGYTKEEFSSLTLQDIEVGDSGQGRADNVPDSQLYRRQHRLKSGEIRDVQAFQGGVDIADRKLMYSIILDNTEHKQSEEQRYMLQSAIHQAPLCIMILDADGIVQYANPAYENLCGYSCDSILNKPVHIGLEANPTLLEFDEIRQALKSGSVFRKQVDNAHANGALFTESVIVSPIRDQERRVHSYIVFRRDITREIGLEAQLHQAQRLESIGRLAGGVAHDFNNMLSVILGYAGIAQRLVKAEDPVYNHLQEISRAAERSTQLTSQLLAFARKQVVSPTVVQINDTIDGMSKMLKRLIGETIELKTNLAEDVHRLRIDPGQIDQILANLCVNARDAIAGSGVISIETSNAMFTETYGEGLAQVFAGEYVQISVSDSGSGMDEATMKQIFDPFFTTKKAGEGTGLGLATVYGIVKQNHGFVHVYSEVGKGTTFRIYFPRHKGDDGDQNQQDESMAELPHGDETILLVEDEASLLSMAEMILQSLGYKVLSAGSPLEALDAIRSFENRVDLLLTDVVMPGMNGKELSEKVKEIYPDIHVIFMSGYTANTIDKEGKLGESIEFVAKPFSFHTLSQKIRNVLDA